MFWSLKDWQEWYHHKTTDSKLEFRLITVLCFNNTKAGVNKLSALTSIFQWAHLLEEITRDTLKTKRTEVITDLREITKPYLSHRCCWIYKLWKLRLMNPSQPDWIWVLPPHIVKCMLLIHLQTDPLPHPPPFPPLLHLSASHWSVQSAPTSSS